MFYRLAVVVQRAQNYPFFIGQNMQLCDVLVAEGAYGLFFLLLVLNEQSWPRTKIFHYAGEIRHPTLMVANLSKCCGHYGQSDWPLFSRSCCVTVDNGCLRNDDGDANQDVTNLHI